MLANIFVVALLAVLVAATESYPSTTTSGNHKRYIGSETGCTCQGISVAATPNSPTYPLLFGAGQDSWCWESGDMTPESVERIQQGIDMEDSTHFVNGTHIVETCRLRGVPLADCAAYIAEVATTLYDPEVLVKCGDPLHNLRPSNCQCGGKHKADKVRRDNAPSALSSGIPRQLVARRECPWGQSLCPIPIRNGGARGFECIDTSSDLEACGGCPGDGGTVDCSALPHVGVVGCVDGACRVSSCKRGFVLSAGRCVKRSKRIRS